MHLLASDSLLIQYGHCDLSDLARSTSQGGMLGAQELEFHKSIITSRMVIHLLASDLLLIQYGHCDLTDLARSTSEGGKLGTQEPEFETNDYYLKDGHASSCI